MNSMTGYGKADYRDRKQAIGVEISSVNNRFLEYTIRLPRELTSLEPRIKEIASTKVHRGKINININYEDYGIGMNRLVLNKPLADEIYRNLMNIKKTHKLSGEIDINHFLNFPDIFRIEKPADLEKRVWPQISRTFKKALNELLNMRRKEGANLKKDINKRLRRLLIGIKEIKRLSSGSKAVHRDRLQKRLSEALDLKDLDKERLEEEVVYIVERTDITEECVRIESHIKQFQSIIRESGPMGKKLNFILQEIGRESNTIGAKAANSDISHIIVDIKEEVERIREQVQNIE